MDAASSAKADAKASAKGSTEASVTTKNEGNGIVTEHVLIGSSLNFNAAAKAFTGISGYTPTEAHAIGLHGSTAVSADGSVNMFHDALTIIHSTEGGKQADIVAEMESKQEAAANAAAETAAKLSAAIVQEGAICIDESGKERKFGDAWVYASDVCEICTCYDSGQVRCTKKTCDPYPECPDGQFVVEEKVDECCMSYRLVKDDCDMSLCKHKAPKCSFYQTLHVYPTDNCCATYECVCDPSLCPDLGNPACPDGSVRVLIDSNQCCKVGKCVDAAVKAQASANAGAQLSTGEFSFISGTSEKKLSNIAAEVATEAAAGAVASAQGSQGADVSVHTGNKGESYTTAVFSPGLVNLGAGANAAAGGQFGMHYGFPSGMGYLGANAESNAGLSLKNGHFEVITKTGGEGGSVIDVSAKGDLSAKADAQASGSHEAEVFVDGGKHGGDMTKFVYTPGQIRADADANAQVAGHLGYAGLPGHFMGQLKADAAAKSDLAFDGGSFSFTHYGDEGHLGDIKAALKGDLEAAADAQVSGSHNAAVRVDGGKKGGSSFELKYHPGQVNAQAAADANAAGHYGIYGGPFGGKGHLAAAANANSNLAISGGSLSAVFGSSDDSGSKVELELKSDAAASSKAQLKGSSSLSLQIADEAALCLDRSGKERMFGECWQQNDDPCKLCSCVDADTIKCKAQECDPYPHEVEGKVIVEEKTSECCSTYRYVSPTCDVTKCQYQP